MKTFVSLAQTHPHQAKEYLGSHIVDVYVHPSSRELIGIFSSSNIGKDYVHRRRIEEKRLEK